MKKITDRKFLEGLIIAAVILALIQVFFDEYARYARWSVSSRNILLYAGFLFDLLFSIEFVVRSILSGKKGLFLTYIRYERGWADFLSSFLLLIFYSGPSAWLLVYGNIHTGVDAHGVLVVLNAVKASVAAGMLRSVRVIKLIGKILNSGSRMTRHHTEAAATTAVLTVVCVLIFWPVFTGLGAGSKVEKKKKDYSRIIEELADIAWLNNIEFRESCENFLARDPDIIKVEYNSGYVYEKLSQPEFKKYYSEEDYFILKGERCLLTVSIKDIGSEVSLQRMPGFLLIISLALSFMMFYSRHFAQTVSDVAHILNTGFRKKDYNLMVKIRKEYCEEELYRLAQFYNDAYLPAKLKKLGSNNSSSSTPFTIKDVMDFDK